MLKKLAKSAGVAATGGKPLGIDEPTIVFDAYGTPPGVMLDVGSHYGWALEPFAKAGWMVHAFEPDPANFAELENNHGARANVTINNVGVSNEEGTLPLYTSEESTGISSLAPFTDGHTATATVPVTTLATYLEQANISTIDFMKIDVEGFEKHVLDGHDWSFAPRTIVLEFEDLKTTPLGYVWTDLADLLREKGYTVFVSEWAPIVRYGSSHRWRGFAEYPTALADPAGWGNLIATLNDPAPLRRALRNARARHAVLQAGLKVLG